MQAKEMDANFRRHDERGAGEPACDEASGRGAESLARHSALTHLQGSMR
jgi:hypothetical protein